MNKLIILTASLLLTTAVYSETPVPPNTPPTGPDTENAPKVISIQEMLVSGPPDLKLFSLSMITQGKYEGEIDESFIPGLTVCANDPALPVRSVTARLLGKHFIQNLETPNPEAVKLLMKLASDPETDVRYSAVYYGLAHVANKSPKVLNMLIDAAASTREVGLYDRLIDSLKGDKEAIKEILDRKLEKEAPISIFEVYEDLVGAPPKNAEKYLSMPSSRPKLFVFMAQGSDAEALKSELEKELKNAGLESPELAASGTGDHCALLLKTYITKDYLAVEKAFSKHPRFPISQEMWLTPQMEIQIQELNK
ncbi:MAG: HEAT repeat domain-containing protein [Pontiellaceae bacterium]|nr:HEAT repeat domain-containing protein [Pontiellaceae bacterium]MBN2783507.1 HEAT repeat domain-containing protein [Pontiellaceae bacterium]